METFLINGTFRTPAIKFDPAQGILEIKGRSIPENATQFYSQLLNLLDQYITQPVSPTQLDIQLDYINTDSSRCLIEIFKRLETIQNKGSQVVINWYYEKADIDMREVGEDFKSIISLNFNIEQRELS